MHLATQWASQSQPYLRQKPDETPTKNKHSIKHLTSTTYLSLTIVVCHESRRGSSRISSRFIATISAIGSSIFTLKQSF